MQRILFLMYGIPKPINFAYPDYELHPTAYHVLGEKGYNFARIGGDRTYDPTLDHLICI